MSSHTTGQGLIGLSPKLHVVIILAIASSIALGLTLFAPSAQENPQPKQRMNVAVMAPQPSTYQPQYTNFGHVEPRHTLTVSAQMDGHLQYLANDLIEGGFIPQGQLIFRQDQRDLQALKVSRQAELAIATAQLALELGEQRIAEVDYKMMQQDFNEQEWQLDHALLLRKPQLSQAKSQVRIAQSAVKLIDNDLQRSQLISPQDFVVTKALVKQGDYLTQGSPIAQLTSLATVRVALFLPRALVNQVDVGQVVSLYQPDTEQTLTAHISEILPAIDPLTQQQKLFVEYQNPQPKQAKLIIGDYVEASMALQSIDNTLTLPLAAIDHDKIWQVTQQNTLLSQPVKILFQDHEQAIIANPFAQPVRIVNHRMHQASDGLAVNIVEAFSE
ncbi:efflux RND transporter periplasmic adaptor subunit [Shewanella waksmanii]|uniref:efflux RND transporter periplasmic adaptor subunit n=1 Tax=Shewanella waksmanii TaxID=213783 RepID=UPI003736CCFD